MNTSNEVLVQKAYRAIKAGEKQKARVLLQHAIRQDAQDYTAWAWLATVTPSPTASLDYAHRAKRLKPNDPFVHKVLVWAKQRVLKDEQQGQKEIQRTDQESKIHLWNSKAVLIGGGMAVVLLVVSIAALFIWRNLYSTTTVRADSSVAVADLGGMELPDAQRDLPVVEATPLPEQAEITPSPTVARLLAKNIAVSGDGQEVISPRATWTMTPVPTPTYTPTPTYMPTFVSPQEGQPVSRPFGVGVNERWIDVNLNSQALTAYEGDELVFSTLISSGTWQYPTVTGQFRIWVRYSSQTMDGRRLGYDYYLENVPYVMYFYQDYALHGTFWHNNFGTPMSHGCVNMRTSDAEWIFKWSSIGTLVNVHY